MLSFQLPLTRSHITHLECYLGVYSSAESVLLQANHMAQRKDLPLLPSLAIDFQ